MASPARSIVSFNQTGLELGAVARQTLRAELALVTPIGGLDRRRLTPMNVICADLDETTFVLHWALPVDDRRLTCAPTSTFAADAFDDFWYLVDEEITRAAGPAVFWEAPVAVGAAPSGQWGWVELAKPRPWLELAELDDGNRLLVGCSAQEAKHFKLQADLPGWAIEVTGGTVLEARNCMAELAHFAVLDPRVEGFTRAGRLSPQVAADVRQAFHRFPQRAGGFVLREP